LIKPPSGHAVAYVDWSNAEFGIAAKLSGDELMQQAYRSGDSYLEFGKQAGKLPQDATKDSHPDERQQLKSIVLGLQYGMGAKSLAFTIGQPGIVARNLIQAHRETYKKFWRWSDAAVDRAMLYGSLHTVFGWTVHVGEDANPRSLRNFPVQANCAEALRLACCLATERGIEVCAPVHDALMICAPLDRIDADIAATRSAMREASAVVLNGFELRTDASVTRYPARYMDPRGLVMWNRVMGLLQPDAQRRTA
jgi:DNA polymerase I-like protein with 3'-5' exonuclease and polymerase domains